MRRTFFGRAHAATGVLMLCLAVPAPAQLGCEDQVGNGRIGVYFDAAGQRPCGILDPTNLNTLYVVARTEGSSATGLSAAEFRVEVTAPAGWLMFFNADPSASIVLGTLLDMEPQNPTNPAGIAIAYTGCRTGAVVLGTLMVLPFATAQPTELIVRRKEPPLDLSSRAPAFFLCDSPTFTRVPLTPTDEDLGREPVVSRSGLGTADCPACGADLPCVDPSDNGIIGVFADPSGTDGCLSVPSGEQRTAYVIASLAGATVGGIQRAQFRVEVTQPAGYTFLWTPSPEANFAFGNPVDLTPSPFDVSGVDMTFPTCPSGSFHQVVLGTLLIGNQSGGPCELRVRGPSPFNLPENACAALTPCMSAPVCLATSPPGREAIVSRSSLNTAECLVCPEPPPPPPPPPCADTMTNGTIGVFASATSKDGCLSAPPFMPVNATVIAQLDGVTASGITGADFRIELSNPTGYLFQWVPDLGVSLPFGNPIDETPNDGTDTRGAFLGFASCQTGTGSRIVLGSIMILNLGTGQSCELRTKRRNPPVAPTLKCPLLLLCDGPVSTNVCLTPNDNELGREGVAFRGTLNGDPCVSCGISGPVAVRDKSWSQIKGMYR